MSVIFFSTSSILSSSITTAKKGKKRTSERAWASPGVSDVARNAREQGEEWGKAGEEGCQRADAASPSSASVRGP